MTELDRAERIVTEFVFKVLEKVTRHDQDLETATNEILISCRSVAKNIMNLVPKQRDFRRMR